MIFNTISYVVFLAASVAAFWILPNAWRAGLILALSIIIYGMWRWEFLLLITFSAFVDYYFSLKIHDEQREDRRKLWLILSLSTNLALLLYFKYAYFVAENVSGLGALIGQDWRFDIGTIILPLGISFYTFLSVSYTVDVYRRVLVPTRNFFTYLTYVMFWPHMIAGPILRAHELMPQITRVSRFDAESFAEGIRKITFGLFLKVGVADQIAPYVNEAFATNPSQVSALDVWTMAFAFGLQIYLDFSAYSMIAIGSALLVGIRFPENFYWPYLATSPREFWRRWHITLSSWIRDYLYLPLSGAKFQSRSGGGLEVGVLRPEVASSIAALFITWFLMGLWHGASWTFALWGLWHAAFIWLYRVTAPSLKRLPWAVRTVGGWAVTLAVVMLGWIPFRAHSVGDALALVAWVFDIHAYATLTFRENFYFVTALIFLGVVLSYFVGQAATHLRSHALWKAGEVGALAFAFFIVFIFLRPLEQFIYFQF